MKSVVVRLGVMLLMLTVLGACKDKAPVCPDVSIVDGCTARCSRVKATKGDVITVCVRQLMVKADAQNDIMKSDIHQVQTRKLPKEECFDVKNGQLSDQSIKDRLKKFCGTSK